MPREIITYPRGVRVYPPSPGRAYWRVTWTPRGGRRQFRSAVTMDDALDLAERLSDQLRTGAGVRGDEPMRQLLDEWLESPHDWDGQTRRAREGTVRLWLAPHLGAIAVEDVSNTNVQVVLDKIAAGARGRARGNGRATQERTLHVLRAAWRWGQANNFVRPGHAPFEGVQLIKPAARKRGGPEVRSDAVPTRAQAEALAAQLERLGGNPRWGLMARLTFSSGLRWAELCALRPEALDLDGATVEVVRVWNEAKRAEEEPKGSVLRTTIYNPALSELIQARIAEVETEHQRDLNPHRLLFPSSKGSWLNRSNFARSLRHEAQRAAGWPEGGYYTWHGLRHGFAHYALTELKLPLSDVAAFLGHADLAFTLRRYVGTTDERFDRAAAAWTGLVA